MTNGEVEYVKVSALHANALACRMAGVPETSAIYADLYLVFNGEYAVTDLITDTCVMCVSVVNPYEWNWVSYEKNGTVIKASRELSGYAKFKLSLDRFYDEVRNTAVVTIAERIFLRSAWDKSISMQTASRVFREWACVAYAYISSEEYQRMSKHYVAVYKQATFQEDMLGFMTVSVLHYSPTIRRCIDVFSS